MWTFRTDEQTGISVRDVTISTPKGGDAVTIIQFTDVHLNYCTDEDLDNPTLKSTWENRNWLRITRDGGEYRSRSLNNLKSCLDFVDNARPSQLIVTGDILDYLSEGCFEFADEYIFSRYPDMLACLGNHEICQRAQGKVGETLSFDERADILKKRWICDTEYVSRVLSDKVMLVVMNNATAGEFGSFTEDQVTKLEEDIATAREKNYAVLLFYHIPLATENPKYRETHAESYVQGTSSTAVCDYETGGISSASKDESTRKAYELITGSADVIKAAFCGHNHNDYYTEINAAGGSGTDVIPQYILIGTPYGNGSVLKITVN